MNYAATISYDGTAFCGWQRQSGVPTVQQSLEEAIGKIFGESTTVFAAGRTDAGVHGKGQVVSFELPAVWDPGRLLLAINYYLPETVRIMNIYHVSDDFNARFSALWREYRYYIWHGPAFPPYLRERAWWNRWKWDKEAVGKACEYVRGTHDFRAFCPIKECPDNTIRTIYTSRWHQNGQLSIVTIRGNAFLMNMVRILIGSLDLVGKGKQSPEWIRDLLNGKGSRRESGMTVPAHGLYFWRVGYDASPFLNGLPKIKEKAGIFVPSDFWRKHI